MLFAPVQSGSQEMGKSPKIRVRKYSALGSMVCIIKKCRFSTRFFAAIPRVLAAMQTGNARPYSGIDTSIALPTLNEDQETESRYLWSMEQEWSNSQ